MIMLHIDLTQTKPGMTIGMPILHPQRPDSILLKAGFRVDEKMIRRLRDLNQKAVWVVAPGFESIDQLLSSSIELGRRRLLGVVTQALGDIYDPRGKRQMWDDFAETLAALTETLVAEPAAAQFMEDDDPVEYRMLSHAANVAYLSTLIGMKLQGYLMRQRKRLNAKHATNLVTLGLAAMLHDVGLSQLSESVLVRWEEHHDELDPAWQKHVQFGYEILTGKVDPTAAAAVLHHHQYFDGTGFPQKPNWDGQGKSGLRGDSIHVFARIVTVADQFDELRTFYSSRPRPNVAVLAQLTSGRMRRRFDPVVLRTLLEIVPAYSPGRRVTLSTGEEAFVLAWRPADPCRPKVAVIDDLEPLCRGEMPPHRLVDLAATPEVSITHSGGVDVSDSQFSLAEDIIPRGGQGLNVQALDAA